MQAMNDKSIWLVFVDKKIIECSRDEAVRMCTDDRIRGRIMDALTGDAELRSFLRERIDK